MIYALFRVREQALGWLVGLLILLMAGANTAHACACESISPAQGFARAQYVFTGKVVDVTGHTWTVDVDRVWKGADKLAAQVRLLDVYNGIDCEFYFEPGRTYLFFATWRRAVATCTTNPRSATGRAQCARRGSPVRVARSGSKI